MPQNRLAIQPGSIAPRADREPITFLSEGSIATRRAPPGDRRRPASPRISSSLLWQRLDKIGFQEAAPVVTKHLGFCDVVGGERFLEVGVLVYPVPEVLWIIHPDRRLKLLDGARSPR